MDLPARIGKYELVQFLGGGMSHVYRAKDTVLGRTVAVKILTEQGCLDEDSKNRFLAEARMSSLVSHDNIIKIHDYGEDNGKPFLVMEFLVGQDLREAIRNGAAGDLRNRIAIALQVARALEYVHAQKIVHRDIKPENIHLDSSGRAKLMDFGIAKSEGLSMTKTGFALGTPYYMAPEQVLGHKVTELVDVYAFGILLYELVTGQKPITGDSVERLFYQILHEPLNMAPLQEKRVPQELQNLILRCTAKEPAERMPNFTLICRELESFLGTDAAAGINQGRPTTSPSLPAAAPAKRSAMPLLIGIGALLLLALIGGVLYSVLHGKAGQLAPVLTMDTGDMVLVPTGPFLAGKEKKNVVLKAYYIDKTEVTNRAYAKFCEAKGRGLPPGFRQDQLDYAVTNISFIEAQEFAKWAGKRLPSELEWEKAARGTDGRTYPWGDEQEPRRANVSDNPNLSQHGAMPVLSFAEDASPMKTLNMAGNVWEFVDELRTPSAGAVARFSQHPSLRPPATPTEPWYIVKGGGYDRPLADAVPWEWMSVPGRLADAWVGFRCAKDAAEPK